jgi:hypothetical protein
MTTWLTSPFVPQAERLLHARKPALDKLLFLITNPRVFRRELLSLFFFLVVLYLFFWTAPSVFSIRTPSLCVNLASGFGASQSQGRSQLLLFGLIIVR